MLDVKPFSSRDTRFQEFLRRFRSAPPEAEAEAAAAIEAIRSGGETALLELSQKCDCEFATLSSLRLDESEIADARGKVSERFLTALSLARVNLRKFHEYQRRRGYVHDDGDGVRLSRVVRPLGRVGILCGDSFATLLACAVPAQVAGVGAIALAARPGPDGAVDPRILAAARILGIDEVYRIGGAHAAAALAFGVDPVVRVDKIVGGGEAVAEAAMARLSGWVGTTATLNGSEMAVIADSSANARFIASDLLAQAAHSRDGGMLVLFTTDRLLAEAVRIEINRLAEHVPNGESLLAAVRRHGALYVCKDLVEALRAVNMLAPARLELMTQDDAECLGEIENAGAVFVGPWSAEAVGDYFSGVAPLFPYGGTARFSSGLGVEDFIKEISVVEYSPDRLLKVGRHLLALAEDAGEPGHVGAIQERLELLRLVTE